MPRVTHPTDAPAQLYQILAWSPRPLKAKELAELLAYMSKCSFDRHAINVMLYRLKECGVVARDGEFRWVACATVTREEVKSLFGSTSIPKREKRTRESELRSVTNRVGHWNFTLGHEPTAGREVWIMECTICGAKVGHRVQHHEYLLPLTGNLAERRRKHDRTSHPDLVREQAQAERVLLGKEK